MKSNLNIPKQLKVGFQNSENRLSYVTYINLKGQIAKETSWRNWMKPYYCQEDKSIIKDFDNTPQSGFKINDFVGGKPSWSQRQSYCRILDPRGFEFEITIDNLMFLFEYCNIENKTLSGELCYAWDGSNLLLLPCSSEEYRQSLEVTDKREEGLKVTVKDLVPGKTYSIKDTPMVYIGYMTWNTFSDAKDEIEQNTWYHNEYIKYTSKKYHTFYDKEAGFTVIHGSPSIQYEYTDIDTIDVTDLIDKFKNDTQQGDVLDTVTLEEYTSDKYGFKGCVLQGHAPADNDVWGVYEHSYCCNKNNEKCLHALIIYYRDKDRWSYTTDIKNHNWYKLPKSVINLDNKYTLIGINKSGHKFDLRLSILRHWDRFNAEIEKES